jgi:transcriptional regulator with XRE-family HTH domain
MSLDDLAQRAEVVASTVHTLEHGNLNVRLETFLRVIGALGLSPVDFLPAERPPGDRLTTAAFERELQARARDGLPQLFRLITRLLDAPPSSGKKSHSGRGSVDHEE